MNPTGHACKTQECCLKLDDGTCVVTPSNDEPGKLKTCALKPGVVTENDGTWVVTLNDDEMSTLVAPRFDDADSLWFRIPKVATGSGGESEDVTFPKEGYMVHNGGADPKKFKYLTSQQNDSNMWMLGILECWADKHGHFGLQQAVDQIQQELCHVEGKNFATAE